MTNSAHNIPATGSLTLLQFYADWCQPCKMMMPIVASIMKKDYEWLTILQVDVDQEQAMASQYSVRSIPTFVVLKDNQEIWRNSGMLSERSLTEELTSLR